MAKQGTALTPPEEALVEMSPPRPGGKEIVLPQGRFFNFERPGQQIDGYLLGQTRTKNQRGEEHKRWVLLLPTGRDVLLPDHRDLEQKLNLVWNTTGAGARLWIGYQGRIRVPGVSSPMARYLVVEYSTEPEEKARVQQTVSTFANKSVEDAPF
jgi:hypothetical protein